MYVAAALKYPDLAPSRLSRRFKEMKRMAMLELQEKEAEIEPINADKCREEMKQAEKAEEQRKGVTDKSQNMLNKIDRQTKRQPRLWELHNDTAQTVLIFADRASSACRYARPTSAASAFVKTGRCAYRYWGQSH